MQITANTTAKPTKLYGITATNYSIAVIGILNAIKAPMRPLMLKRLLNKLILKKIFN